MGNELAFVHSMSTSKPTHTRKVVVATFLKFAFQMDSVVLKLSKGSVF